MDKRDFEWIWGNIWYILDLLGSRGLMFIYAWCVSLKMIPYGSMDCGPLIIEVLLLHGVLTLLYFWVSPVSMMP